VSNDNIDRWVARIAARVGATDESVVLQVHQSLDRHWRLLGDDDRRMLAERGLQALVLGQRPKKAASAARRAK
jgi:hypothetical protein